MSIEKRREILTGGNRGKGEGSDKREHVAVYMLKERLFPNCRFVSREAQESRAYFAMLLSMLHPNVR